MRAFLPPPNEIVLQVAVAGILDDYLRPDWRWTHIPNGEHRNLYVAKKLKRMGVKRGWPDVLLLGPRGLFMLELKKLKAKQTPEQKALQEFCEEYGHVYGLADTLEGAVEYLNRWNCLKIKLKL